MGISTAFLGTEGRLLAQQHGPCGHRIFRNGAATEPVTTKTQSIGANSHFTSGARHVTSSSNLFLGDYTCIVPPGMSPFWPRHSQRLPSAVLNRHPPTRLPLVAVAEPARGTSRARPPAPPPARPSRQTPPSWQSRNNGRKGGHDPIPSGEAGSSSGRYGSWAVAPLKAGGLKLQIVDLTCKLA